ncbi:MAG: hypothetical protein LAN59_06625 [Acidobacteriia bacterium]|nr:hypothetical protein [Terriglobia bacterium]
MMLKTVLRGALLGALLVAIGSFAYPGSAAPDEGKSLVTMAPPAAPAASDPCDRACLNGFVDKYFEALLSRCACGIALAPGVKYTENGQVVKPGEGIWKTFTGRGNYRVYLADPATGQAGYYGDFNEYRGTLFGVMALRLKVEERRITEIEVIAVREQLRPKGGLGANTAGVMTPKMIDELQAGSFVVPDAALLAPVAAAGRSPRAQLIAASDLYYQGFTQNKGALAAFAEPCSRRENGVAATNNSDGPVVDPAQPAFRVFSQGCAGELDRGFFSALAKFRNRRAWVVDEEQGLMLDLALFDNEGDVRSVSVPGAGQIQVPPEFLRPITYVQPHLFKIERGKIREIEGLSWPVPFGMQSGWEN